MTELERTIFEDINENATDYYKLGNPVFQQELDWAITFSKYNFPWREIAFYNFSSKDCYLKYTQTVRDAKCFFKKILGNKEKYKKYVEN